MNTLKLSSLSLNNIFRRRSFDPTTFGSINDKWDEKSSSNSSVEDTPTAARKYANPDMLFASKYAQVKQRLDFLENNLEDINE